VDDSWIVVLTQLNLQRNILGRSVLGSFEVTLKMQSQKLLSNSVHAIKDKTKNSLLATDLETGIRYNQLLLFNTFHHQIIQKINLPKK
jgi:hypothetical protein